MKPILGCLTIGLLFVSLAHANENFVCENQKDLSDKLAMKISNDDQNITFDKIDSATTEFDARTAVLEVQFLDKTFNCSPSSESVQFESFDTAPYVEQVGWRVTSHDDGVTYAPPVIQHKSPGRIEQYTASESAMHLRKGCRIVSRDGGVIYDPPIVRCARSGYIEKHSAAKLIPGLPF